MEPRWRQLAVLSLAELLALSLWFTASAVLPALSREWHLDDGGRAGLTIAVQLGFIVGTFGSALANLADLWPARRLMVVSALVGADEYPLDPDTRPVVLVRSATSSDDELVAEIKARRTGELFLYVNDAIIGLRSGAGRFYANNGGQAQVEVARLGRR